MPHIINSNSFSVVLLFKIKLYNMWIFLMFFSFFKLEFTPCKAECEWHTRHKRHTVTRNSRTKRWNVFRKAVKTEPKERRCLSNLDFVSLKITGQKKVLSSLRIPDSSCARKWTVYTDILLTSKKSDQKKSCNQLK